MKFQEFEQQGLKIEEERVLVYSKLSCPLECTYCFVDEMNQEQSKNITYLNNEQLTLLQNLPEHVKLIMLGCDTEFFQNKREALDTLEKLSRYGKDISVITKIPLSEDYVKSLATINSRMLENGNLFSFSISLPCLSSGNLEKFEPRVPSPERRIETLRMVNDVDIPTFVAVRPLIPDVSNEELEHIVNLTKDFCLGYYSGPVYLQEEKIRQLFPDFESDPEKEHQPAWMLDGNKFQAVVKKGQMETLMDIVKKAGKIYYEGAADAVESLRNNQNEKFRNQSQN